MQLRLRLRLWEQVRRQLRSQRVPVPELEPVSTRVAA